MTIKFSASEIRFICQLTLSPSSATHSFLSSAEIESIARRAGWLSADDKASMPSRTDSKFRNRVNNIVCHRDVSGNPIRARFVNYNAETASFSLLERGRDFLQKVDLKLGGTGNAGHEATKQWLKRMAQDDVRL